jgi:RNA polymerase sigma-70 factor (ECF subfamily)
MPNTAFEDTSPGQGQWFATTHWSVVLAAGHSSVLGAQDALEKLCRAYWYPLYAFIRRQNHSPHDAQDLTQGFFAALLQSEALRVADPERGKFRSFLLARLKNFLSDERKRAGAQKRGGDRLIVSIDEHNAESRYQFEPVESATPDALFEREWALTILDQVTERLRRRYAERGRGKLFAELEPCLGGSGKPVSYAEIGARLEVSEAAVKVATHRLRKEFGAELRAEIAQTVADPAEIDAEIRQLIAVTSR